VDGSRASTGEGCVATSRLRITLGGSGGLSGRDRLQEQPLRQGLKRSSMTVRRSISPLRLLRRPSLRVSCRCNWAEERRGLSITNLLFQIESG
jgi:hypothetical protein